jgi:hypothetical protein
MSALAEKRLNVDEFLAWADGREGKWELHDGVPVLMSPERVRDAAAISDATLALSVALDRAGVPCRAHARGINVRISENHAFVPDALVVYPAPFPDDRETSGPLIVVGPFSRTAEYYGLKLEGYFSLPSLAHYLILDRDRRVVIHHARGREGVIETRILHDGRLRLDPPGLDVAVEELFASAD